jgi:hypothetical protein
LLFLFLSIIIFGFIGLSSFFESWPVTREKDTARTGGGHGQSSVRYQNFHRHIAEFPDNI